MRFIYLLFFMLLPCAVCSQQTERNVIKRQKEKIKAIGAVYADSITNMSQKFQTWKYEKDDTLSNPYYYAIFASPTYYNYPVHRNIGYLDYRFSEGDSVDEITYYSQLLDRVSATLVNAYAESPWLIVNDENQESGKEGIREDVNTTVAPHVKFSDRLNEEEVKDLVESDNNENWNIVVRKPTFWTFKSTFSLQFTQNHVSDNWYKGGESNNSLQASSEIEANFNNKQKITFTNKLEMRLGFQSLQHDEKHKFKTNSDLIRLTDQLGLRALKHWNYTVTLQSWTQFYHGYKSNDDKVYSDFMSPFESVLSIGMNYELKPRNFSLTATISPLAVHFRYVGRKYLATSFGVDEGKHTNYEYGSTVTINHNWNVFKNVSWNGRIYYFSDYEKTLVEWENTINFKINQLLSSKLFLHTRFDDSVRRKEDNDTFFQFKEMFSLSLNVSF